jgi:type II secretory pathway predicted ATPase ExeA
MYEQHFGLEKRPFSVKATGTEVFVGPQTAKTMAGFRKALASQDAVVTVSGAAGTGKTTLVERALDAIGSKYKTVRVGRMQMNASDVLESLLIVLGVTDRPSGTIQRFTVLRKKLKDLQDAGTRVFIVVEDALRAGTETLAEIEALTVADAGESDGAGIVLMGDERLFEFMKDPALAQLQQRVRQRHRIKALCVAELRGYLKHSLRMAGGDFDQVFDSRSAELIHALSEGIPRVANNLVDAVLVTAATQRVTQIPATLIAAVASNEFGLSSEDFDFTGSDEADHPLVEPAPAADVADTAEESAPADEAAPDVAAEESVPAPDLIEEPATAPDVAETAEEAAPVDEATPAVAAKESIPASDPDAETTPEAGETPDPVIVFADADEKSPEGSMDIPHLIQDTLPDLAILSQRYATLAESYEADAGTQESAAEPEAERSADNIPELMPEPIVDAAAVDAPEVEHVTPAAVEVPDVEHATPAAVDAREVEPVTPAAEQVAVPEPAAEPKWELTTEPEFELVAGVVPALEAAPTPETNAGNEGVPELRAEPARETAAKDIPQLHVEPDAVAENAPAVPPKPVDAAVPEPVTEVAFESADLPELDLEQPVANVAAAGSEPNSAEEEIPEWERDPTLAQLKPDLDALEQAMAFTHGEEAPINGKDAAVDPEKLAESVADLDEIPEIILDQAIETGIGDLEFEEPSDICPPVPAQKSDPELDRIAADIANAKSLEDIDDIMAETLFGSGISMIAAQVTANPPTEDSANDALELAHELPAAPVAAAKEKVPPVARNKAAPRRSEISEEISIETRAPVANTGLDLSASQRLKTVRALNADLHPSLREPENAPGARTRQAIEPPQTIEDQINTSITQTLKALKVPPELLDDDDDEPKKGFLSRFRRS